MKSEKYLKELAKRRVRRRPRKKEKINIEFKTIVPQAVSKNIFAAAMTVLSMVIIIPTLLFSFMPKQNDGRDIREKIKEDGIDNIVISDEAFQEQAESIEASMVEELTIDAENVEEPDIVDEEEHKLISPENAETKRLRFTEYTVKKGDNAWDIAKAHRLRVDSVIGANDENIDDPSILRVGQKLRLPNMDGIYYVVKANDTLSGISERYNANISIIKEVNGIENDVIHKGEKIFIAEAKLNEKQRRKLYRLDIGRPVHGYLTSPYGYRMHPILNRRLFHTGIDIGGNNNYRVYSVLDGKVTFAGKNGAYGNFIMIRHKMGYTSCYAHLRRINVKKGQWVKRGDVIGRVGSTGRSMGAHLHFEIRINGKFANPAKYLSYRSK